MIARMEIEMLLLALRERVASIELTANRSAFCTTRCAPSPSFWCG